MGFEETTNNCRKVCFATNTELFHHLLLASVLQWLFHFWVGLRFQLGYSSSHTDFSEKKNQNIFLKNCGTFKQNQHKKLLVLHNETIYLQHRLHLFVFHCYRPMKLHSVFIPTIYHHTHSVRTMRYWNRSISRISDVTGNCCSNSTFGSVSQIPYRSVPPKWAIDFVTHFVLFAHKNYTQLDTLINWLVYSTYRLFYE